jgi:hypothetical protein
MEKHEEWRIITPILLGVLTVVVLPTLGYLMIDKLNQMTDKSDKAFVIISKVKDSFDEYRVSAEARFTKLETELGDLPKYLAK